MESVILVRPRFDIFVHPVFITTKFLWNTVSRDNLLKRLDTVEEMDLGRDDGIKDRMNELPKPYSQKSTIDCRRERESRTNLRRSRVDYRK